MILRTVYVFSLLVFTSLAGLLATNSAYGQRNDDAQIQAMLPPYCRNAQDYRDRVRGGNNPAEIERWKQVMGEGNFLHIHHYCYGLEHTNRALYTLRTMQDRHRALRYAIGEFDYVIARVPDNFALLPEILTKRGENLLRLRNVPEAIPTLVRAIEIKGDYWPPYAALSDHYKEAGDIGTAREWLKKGLAASPGTTALERRLRELPASSGAR